LVIYKKIRAFNSNEILENILVQDLRCESKNLNFSLLKSGFLSNPKTSLASGEELITNIKGIHKIIVNVRDSTCTCFPINTIFNEKQEGFFSLIKETFKSINEDLMSQNIFA